MHNKNDWPTIIMYTAGGKGGGGGGQRIFFKGAKFFNIPRIAYRNF